MIGKKKVTCLALTALSLISLSSCNDVSTGKNGQILTYDYSGNKLEINTSDIFEKYINENRSDHAKALYDALYEVVVRVNFEKDGLLSSFKKEVEEEATDQVNDEKTKAEDNGQSWEDYLKENVSKDETLSTAQKEQELYLTKLYDNMKTIVEDQYYEEFKDWKEDASSTEDEKKLQQEYNLLYGKQGYINQYMPYHVRHIVIKNDASQDYAYSRGHISSDDAHEIYQVVERLVAGDDFSTVANNFTEDGGNTTDGKLNGGQYIMGIQGTNSAFINEFKLGVYTYDLFLKYNKNGDQLQQNSENINQLILTIKQKKIIYTSLMINVNF